VSKGTQAWFASAPVGPPAVDAVLGYSATVTAPTVLLVDDDTETRESLAELLEQEGYQVVCDVSAEAALGRLLSGFRPAAMVVDFRMSGITGIELLRICRADPSLVDIPAVLISGFDAVKFQRMVGVMCLRKPLDVSNILAVLKAAAPIEAAS
jgi:CheY-like chemotaxis protein